MSEPFIAEIRIVGFNFAPRGWALCDGQLLPISQNTALFSIVGTTYGGDGRSTLALPNLKGRVPIHPGRGAGLSSRRLGEKGGAHEITLTEAHIPPHTHTGFMAVTDKATTDTAAANVAMARTENATYAIPAVGTPQNSSKAFVCKGEPSGYTHNNLQPLQVMNFVIALQGLYPSRS